MNNPKCVMCGHRRNLHNDSQGHCHAPVKVKYKTNSTIAAVTTCNCPEMTYNTSVVRRLIVKVDYRLERRVNEYIASLWNEQQYLGVIPGQSDVIREAINEYLKSRGY